jgi:NTE family protein
MERSVAVLLDQLPEEFKRSEEARYLASIGQRRAYNLVHLIYRPRGYEGDSKDYEFSPLSMAEHWHSGYYDAVRTLRHPEVLKRGGNGEEVTTFDFGHDG